MAAEQELTLRRRAPEGMSPQTPPTVDRLVLSYRARQDFDQATAIVQRSPLSNPRRAGSLDEHWDDLRTTLNIAVLQVQNGLDSGPMTDRVLKYARGLSRPSSKRSAYELVARTHAKNGNLAVAERAFLLSEQHGDPTGPHVYLDMAVGYHKAGQDPQPMLAKAREHAGKMPVGSIDTVTIHYSDSDRVNDLARIVKHYINMGLDPTPVLAEASEIVSRLEATADPQWMRYNYLTLLDAFALQGDTQTALLLVDKIVAQTPDETKKMKAGARYSIAKAQLKRNDLDGALETAMGSGDEIIIAEIHVRIAMIQGESGQDNTHSLSQASSYAERVKKESSQAILYSMIGRAKALVGEDPREDFYKAIEVASQIETYSHAKYLINVAENIDASGYDATPVITLALEAADKITEGSEDGVESLDQIEQVLTWEELTTATINLGYFDLARMVLSRLEGADRLSESGYADFLAKLGAAQVKNGLTRAEINDLDLKDIELILSGENETAKQAAIYFGLTLGAW